MSNGLLIVLTVDGYVNLWEYDNGNGSPPRLLNWERLSIDRKERLTAMNIERFVSIAVCPRNIYVAVSSCYGENDSMRRLFWLRINHRMEIEEKVKTLLTSHHPYQSALRAMVFYGYVSEFPVLYAIEGVGESSLWSFYYDGSQIQYFKEKRRDYMMDEVHKMIKLGDSIYSLDFKGNFLKYSLQT